ncbi:MAG: winged helix-turn-helix domain-containing protein, partial [Chloroflexota bacterium]|nr:winged helix-turn-helix domain-containing protein [Chloroflexota bacterium]
MIALDRTGGAPLHRQVTELLRAAILDGRLPAGARLPSTRALASSVGVSRQVVVAAYDELFAEGYVEGRHGSGTYVVDALQPVDDGAAPIETTDPPSTPRWLRADGPAEAGSWIPNLPPGAIEFRPGR